MFAYSHPEHFHRMRMRDGIRDWCETYVLPVGLSDSVTSVCYDQHQELLWTGLHSGRVTSHLPPTMDLRVSYNVSAEVGDVRAVRPQANVTLSLHAAGLRIISKVGVLQYASFDRKLSDLNSMINNSTHEVLLGGPQKPLMLFDLNTTQIVSEVDTSVGIKFIRRSRQLCTAEYGGRIVIRDPRSCQEVHTLYAHTGEVYDFDVKGDLLVSCGWSNAGRNGKVYIEPMVKVFDMRTMNQLNPIPFAVGANLLKFHPKFSSSIVVVSASGQFQICDAQGDVTSARYYQVDTKDPLTSFDISASGEIICFGDSAGNLRQWMDKLEVKVNDFSQPIEIVDMMPTPPPLKLDETSPLYLLANPLAGTGDSLLSDWPVDLEFPVDHVPERITTEQIALLRKSGYSAIPHRGRNREILDRAEKLLATQHASNPSNTMTSNNPHNSAEAFKKRMRRPPKKYRKIRINSTSKETDFSLYNRTLFSGLDNTFPESHVNSLLQQLYFIAPIHNHMLHHLCKQEYCLSCELGFLFYSLEHTQAQNSPNSNFLRTFRHMPKAATRGLLQFGSQYPHSLQTQNPYSNLLSKCCDFFLEQLHSDSIQHPSTLQTSPGAAGVANPANRIIEKLFGTKIRTTKVCSQCHGELSCFHQIFSVTLDYPSGAQETSNVEFTQVLKNSLNKSSHEDFWCKECNGYRSGVSRVCPLEMAKVLVIHANIQNEAQLQRWIPVPESTSQWVPTQIHFRSTSTGLEFQSGAFEAEDNAAAYELVGVLCQVIDCGDKKANFRDSTTNFVAHVLVPDSYRRSPNSPHSEDLASSEGATTAAGWYLFNDTWVSPEVIGDVLKFAEWKVPAILLYQQRGVHDVPLTTPMRIPEEYFFLENTFERSALLNKQPSVQVSLEQLPTREQLVAIDSEFVSIAPPQRITRPDGRTIEIRPARSSLARVSAIAQDASAERLLIDDYIITREPISDYLTRFSGIRPGDLDPIASEFNVTSLKATYLKLRILVDRGCVFVGHGLRKDFWICNLYLPPSQVRDTVDLFRLPYQRMISLRFLAYHLLDLDIQGDTHDSVEDALTALRLYQIYEKLFDSGKLDKTLQDLYHKGRASDWKLPLDQALDDDLDPLPTESSYPNLDQLPSQIPYVHNIRS